MIESNLIKINERNLYFEHSDAFENRPTLVFLHDSLGCAQLWRDFPALLAEALYYNLLVYDRLGYGKSAPMPTHQRPDNYMELEADVLSELLNELNITNAVLFGHSDGGTIALITASKYPQNIQAVVCEAGHIFVEDTTLKGIYDAWEACKTTNLPQRLQKYHGDKVETLFKAWMETWTRKSYRDWNIEYLLKKITCPLLFIQGENDEYGTLNQVEKTVRQISGYAEKYVIPDTGHTPHKEVPDFVLKKTLMFLQEVLDDKIV